MAFLTSDHENISLRVNDFTRDDTRFGQVAYVVAQGFEQPRNTGIVGVYIKLELVLFSLNGTQLGDQLAEDPRFVVMGKTLDGKNDTLVDAATGEILGMYRQYNDVADWGAFCRSFAGRDVMLQGDYHEQLRKRSIITENEIMHHLQAAMSLGLFL